MRSSTSTDEGITMQATADNKQSISPAAMSVEQFCQSHGICRATFYALLKEGKAPKTIMAKNRRLISMEAAAEWRRNMENAGQ
jgi:predicted DNA-binding transcriptional regulator AlpA